MGHVTSAVGGFRVLAAKSQVARPLLAAAMRSKGLWQYLATGADEKSAGLAVPAVGAYAVRRGLNGVMGRRWRGVSWDIWNRCDSYEARFEQEPVMVRFE